MIVIFIGKNRKTKTGLATMLLVLWVYILLWCHVYSTFFGLQDFGCGTTCHSYPSKITKFYIKEYFEVLSFLWLSTYNKTPERCITSRHPSHYKKICRTTISRGWKITKWFGEGVPHRSSPMDLMHTDRLGPVGQQDLYTR